MSRIVDIAAMTVPKIVARLTAIVIMDAFLASSAALRASVTS